jgi:hypothetical protein
MIVVKAGLCKQGNEFKKGKPLSSSSIPKVSDKRKKQDNEYYKRRSIFLFNNPCCQFFGCPYRSTDVHHKKGRIGDNYLDTSTWMAVCRSHHAWIENNPKEAIEKGYSQLRLTK